MHSEAVMRLDIMHPHRTQDDTATCPRWYSNLGEKMMSGEIASMAQYRHFVSETASLLSKVCGELVAQIGISLYLFMEI